MNKFTDKFSIYFIGGLFGLTAYTFWAASYNSLHFFVLTTYTTMTEHWFLAFAALGALMLHILNTFLVFLIISAAYILFLAWPGIETELLLSRVANHLGDITPSSVLLSPDAFRIYAMLIAITFFDVLNMAYARTKEEEEIQ